MGRLQSHLASIQLSWRKLELSFQEATTGAVFALHSLILPNDLLSSFLSIFPILRAAVITRCISGCSVAVYFAVGKQVVHEAAVTC